MHENTGSGTFARAEVITTRAAGVSYVKTIDMDGDGDLDVVYSSPSGNKIAWHETLGGGAKDTMVTESMMMKMRFQTIQVKPLTLTKMGLEIMLMYFQMTLLKPLIVTTMESVIMRTEDLLKSLLI